VGLDVHLIPSLSLNTTAPQQIEMMNSNKAVFNHILISKRLITMLLSEDSVTTDTPPEFIVSARRSHAAHMQRSQ
jgi:hypothetical protein